MTWIVDASPYSRQCSLKEARLRCARHSLSAKCKALKMYFFSSFFILILFLLLLFFFFHKPWMSCKHRVRNPNLSFFFKKKNVLTQQFLFYFIYLFIYLFLSLVQLVPCLMREKKKPVLYIFLVYYIKLDM